MFPNCADDRTVTTENTRAGYASARTELKADVNAKGKDQTSMHPGHPQPWAIGNRNDTGQVSIDGRFTNDQNAVIDVCVCYPRRVQRRW
jgi:hypothetical protein